MTHFARPFSLSSAWSPLCGCEEQADRPTDWLGNRSRTPCAAQNPQRSATSWLSDRVQVRSVKEKLRLSDAELTEIADGIGNSISAIGKEVATQRARRLPEPAPPTSPPL